MAALSTLARSAAQNLRRSPFVLSKIAPNNVLATPTQVRMSGNFVIQASRWQWHKTKDLFHFYFLVGAIPLSIVAFLANVFVGPATLTEIPEGYEPKYWEYYKHPITRFLARYLYHNPQKDYEKTLATIYDESQIMKIRQLENKVWALQAERKDYIWNYFLPYDTFHLREFRELVKTDEDSAAQP